jgi:myo-inositol-1-phosphate synthase
LKLEVWDSPNSAGIIIDAIRAAKIALDRKIGGPMLSASSYLMKSPPVQYSDHAAREALEGFIAGTVDR